MKVPCESAATPAATYIVTVSIACLLCKLLRNHLYIFLNDILQQYLLGEPIKGQGELTKSRKIVVVHESFL